MLQLASAPSALALLAPAELVCVADSAATSDGLLAYDPEHTPAWLVPVLDALGQPRIGRATDPKRITDVELETLLTALFHKAAINLGHDRAAMDPGKLNMQVNKVADLLRERWHYLTRGEIEQVFDLGSLAQLTPPPGPDGRPTEEVVYLSPKTVGVWLQRYKYQVKPQAMEHARRVTPPYSELPYHHPVFTAWRISRLQRLYEMEPAGLRQLSVREGDFKNLLYFWLKELDALGFKPKPAGFWDRLTQLDKARLLRTGQYPPEEMWLQMATGKREKYQDRLDAAKRWRTLCLWLVARRAEKADLHQLLWPLAIKIYSSHATEAQRANY